jgi:Kef-type K+ transport system membrane component KefB
MAAMGLMVDLAVIRKTGLKALGVATLVFALFVGMSGLLISLLGKV